MEGRPNQPISQLHSQSLTGNPTRRLNRNWPKTFSKIELYKFKIHVNAVLL